MNHSALKKTIIARFKADGGPHVTAEKLGVTAFMLVMFAHGYSKPHGQTIEKIEKKLSGKKSVAMAAKVKRAKR